MNTLNIKIAILALLINQGLNAQNTESRSYGKTLNAGVGIGYYSHVGYSIPVLHANYEIDVAKNFTLAPFITYYGFKNNYYWGNQNRPFKYYEYTETVIPIGVKGSYYFDDVLNANSKWDFYLAGSLGFVFRRTKWEDGYEGSKIINQGTGALYLDAHIGAEYHLTNKTGLFLDLSSGVSTIGLSFHL